MARPDSATNALADEILGLHGTGAQVAPFAGRVPGFDLDAAYAVAWRVRDRRIARGERPVGRKIGFTNRSVWAGQGLSAPIWNWMFDASVRDLAAADGAFALGALPEPRIEPEIALGLARAPDPGMDDADLLACLAWVAPAFEIVASHFPGWAFSAADATAAFGVHGALLVGERCAVAHDPDGWRTRLSTFTVALCDADRVRAEGHAGNVLGGPLDALRFLQRDLADRPELPPLAAGEIVTTGTLTEALPVAPGERWTARFAGIPLAPIEVRFA